MFQLVTGLPAEGGRPSAQGHDARSPVLSDRPIPAPPAGRAFFEVLGEAVSHLGKTDRSSAISTAEDHDAVAATGDALPTARTNKGGTKEKTAEGKEFSPERESKAEATDDRQSEVDDPELPGGANMLAPLVPLARDVDDPTPPEDNARAPGMAATSLPASASSTAQPKVTADVLASVEGGMGAASVPGPESALRSAPVAGAQHDINPPATSASFTAGEEMRPTGRISQPKSGLPIISADGAVSVAGPQSSARQTGARGAFPAPSPKETPLPGSIPISPPNMGSPVGPSSGATKDPRAAMAVFTGKADPAAGARGAFPAPSPKETPLPGSIPISPPNMGRPVGPSSGATKDPRAAMAVFTGKADPAAGARGAFPAPSPKETPLPGSIPISPPNMGRPVGPSSGVTKDPRAAMAVFTGKADPAAVGRDAPPPNTPGRDIPMLPQQAARIPDEARSPPSQPVIGTMPPRSRPAPTAISDRTANAEPGFRPNVVSQYGPGTGATAPAAQGPADKHADANPGRLPPRPAPLSRGETGEVRTDTDPAPAHKADSARASFATNPGVAWADRKGILPAPSTGHSTPPIRASVPRSPTGAGTMSLQNPAETDHLLRPPTDPNEVPDPLLSPGTAPPGSPAQGTAAIHTNPSHMARGVAWQIASAVQNNSQRSFDILLNPAELGKVRISLTPGESGMSVHIQADRPDTLDLLRRHVGILGQDFRELGYESTSFSFGGDGRNARPDSQAGEMTGKRAANPSDVDITAVAHIADSPDTGVRSAPVASGRMDIRL